MQATEERPGSSETEALIARIGELKRRNKWSLLRAVAEHLKMGAEPTRAELLKHKTAAYMNFLTEIINAEKTIATGRSDLKILEEEDQAKFQLRLKLKGWSELPPEERSRDYVRSQGKAEILIQDPSGFKLVNLLVKEMLPLPEVLEAPYLNEAQQGRKFAAEDYKALYLPCARKNLGPMPKAQEKP